MTMMIKFVSLYFIISISVIQSKLSDTGFKLLKDIGIDINAYKGFEIKSTGSNRYNYIEAVIGCNKGNRSRDERDTCTHRCVMDLGYTGFTFLSNDYLHETYIQKHCKTTDPPTDYNERLYHFNPTSKLEYASTHWMCAKESYKQSVHLTTYKGEPHSNPLYHRLLENNPLVRDTGSSSHSLSPTNDMFSCSIGVKNYLNYNFRSSKVDTNEYALILSKILTRPGVQPTHTYRMDLHQKQNSKYSFYSSKKTFTEFYTNSSWVQQNAKVFTEDQMKPNANDDMSVLYDTSVRQLVLPVGMLVPFLSTSTPCLKHVDEIIDAIKLQTHPYNRSNMDARTLRRQFQTDMCDTWLETTLFSFKRLYEIYDNWNNMAGGGAL
eukprot:GHVR01076288.1.p1 GENE.GHVR01076288.1~~GHVR01076288.1.p1  ORF type:complete len:378 (-),score=52.59 GHVR01076288.1:352-1485(-)